jgi:hypothetical protein
LGSRSRPIETERSGMNREREAKRIVVRKARGDAGDFSEPRARRLSAKERGMRGGSDTEG